MNKRDMLTQKINDVLYKHDPVGTCCALVEGMEEEYWACADEIEQTLFNMGMMTREIILRAIISVFEVEEDEVDFDSLTTAYDEIKLLI